MDEGLPFGYRQKRSHAQMDEQERSASPAWSSSLHHQHAHDSSAHLHSRFCPSFHEQRAPLNLRFFPRRSSSDLTRNTPTERPASAGTSGWHLPRPENMASSAPRRYAGDGYDYRRPAGFRAGPDTPPAELSGGEEDDYMHIDLSRDEGDVIDLTADDSGYGPSQDNAEGRPGNSGGENRQQPYQRTRAPRLPRGMDIIIDLDNGQEDWSMAPPQEAGSPEIEFISSRPLDPPRRAPTFGRSNSDGDEVEFVRSQALPAEEQQRRRNREVDRALELIGDMNGRFTHLRAQVARFNDQVNRTAASLRRTHTPVLPPRGAPRARGMVHVGFANPGLFNYDAVGFDMGMEPERAVPAPPPTYEAPPPAAEGFTRNPQAEGELVCPNCEEELCLGDDDQKRQVWIVKACGHVYCGECAANRSVKRSSKGKEKPARTKPFKDCVVEGCGKKVTNAKSMFQIFL